MNFFHRLWLILLAIGLHTIPNGMVYGYTVSDLKSSVHSGQIFFTWTNPKQTNCQYNLYRSTKKMTTSQLTSANLMGFVRDSSGENIRKAQLEKADFYFVIPGNKSPLADTKGLYVLTCTDSKNYYYTVTVTNLSNGQEDKTIKTGNTTSSSISGSIAKPQPVLQTVDVQKNGDSILEYVVWGDNQQTAQWPACNNVGSYAYNFTIQKEGNCKGQPLFVEFQDTNPFTEVTTFTNDINVLQLDDWIPNGENTYWIGYNTGYNMYISSWDNPQFSTGTIMAYTSDRTIETIRFAKQLSGVDSTRVYMEGSSHNGFGAIFTACRIPNEVACVYATVPPILIKAENGTTRVHQWSIPSVNLPTDVNFPGTDDPLLMWDICDLRTWFDDMDHLSGIPYMQGINGKDDNTVGWVQSFHWYDTVNAARQGGTWYWDQRDHNGDGAKFTNDETMPDWERYYTTRSYPAFSYCSINQNPGNGNKNNGDKFGAINGYLDWYDTSIADGDCEYDVTCYVKKMYAGGKAINNQYDSCTTDITLRRLQSFHPVSGQKLKWSIYNSAGTKIQHGSFTYDGDIITLHNIKIYKEGSTVTVKINNCPYNRVEAPKTKVEDGTVQLFREGAEYKVEVKVPQSQQATVRIFNSSGQLMQQNNLSFAEGDNSFNIGELTNGLYILQIQSADLHYGGKLIF